MKFLDKLALNRLVLIILNFILSVIKLVVPNKENDDNIIPLPKPPLRKRLWFPRGKK